MADEEKQLLQQIAFYSNLINNHYNQIPSQSKTYNKNIQSKTQINGGSNGIINGNLSSRRTSTVSSLKRKVNIESSSKNLVRNLRNDVPVSSAKRFVVPTATKDQVKDRVVLPQISTPKGSNFKLNLAPSINLSPIITTPTVETNVKLKEKDNKISDRIVLKPSRYKWTKTSPRSSVMSVKTSALPQENQNNIFIRTKNSLSNSKKEKLSKTVRSKYKFIRGHQVYKLVNKKTPRKSPKFIRTVGKYSIKYVEKNSKSVTKKSSNSRYNSKLFLQPVRRSIYSSPSLVTSLKRRLYKLDKTGKSSDKSRKFVAIGGILYKTSFNKLSRTDKIKSSPTKRPVVAKLNSKVSKMITVSGVKYALDSFGKTLKRVTTNSNTGTGGNRSRIDIGGDTFIQTKPGLFVISQAAITRSFTNRSVNRSINRLVAAKKKSSQYCLFFNRFGKCSKKELGICPYIHDPEKIAVCTRFLQGKCTVENCPFSHTVCTNKMPVCNFFLRGRCSAESCPYRHVNVNPKADVCENFVKGFCALGDECKKLHVFSCPEFEKSGKCVKGAKCLLKHVEKKKNSKKEKNVDEIKKQIEERSERVENPRNKNDDWPSSSKLPSFIRLDDDIESSEQESISSTPLRIRPQFLN